MKAIVWLAILLVSLTSIVWAQESSTDVGGGGPGSTEAPSNNMLIHPQGMSPPSGKHPQAGQWGGRNPHPGMNASGPMRGRNFPPGMNQGNMKQRSDAIKVQKNETKRVMNEIRDLRKEARDNMKEKRNNLKAASDELRTCKGKQTDECKTKRGETKLAIKDTLLSAADEVLKFLDSTKAKISESKLESKDDLIAEINSRVKEVTDAKAKVTALTESSTAAEIKDATNNLRQVVNKAKTSLKVGAHEVMSNKLGNVLASASKLVEKLDNILAKLKEKGVDTSKVDVAAFKAKVDESKKLQNEANDLYQKAKAAEPGKKDELMKQATAKMQEAQKALKAAHTLLTDILQKLKGLKGGSEALASADVSAEASASA